jgi:hypothetical protein
MAGQQCHSVEGTTRHPHPSDARSEAGTHFQCLFLSVAIDIGKGCHYRLRTVEALHEQFLSLSHTFLFVYLHGLLSLLFILPAVQQPSLSRLFQQLLTA